MKAIIFAAGLSGLRTNADLAPFHDIDVCHDGHTVKNAPKRPLELLVVLRELDTELQCRTGRVLFGLPQAKAGLVEFLPLAVHLIEGLAIFVNSSARKRN